VIRLRTKSVDDTRALAFELAALARPGDLFLLAGDLGAGKTAFAQGFGRALGITEPITSPTFTLVRTYEGGRFPMIHVDVYRLDHLQELMDLGIMELLDGDGVTLIEWGDAVAVALPPDFLELRLDLGEDDDERLVSIRAVGTGWSHRTDAIARACERWVQG
jgi:tRNA threonylcarbamoyladenosine biosynthesis protein TsaE